MSEFIKVSFRLAKEMVLEERSETIPFVITVKGVHSVSPPTVFLLVIDTSYSMDGEKIFRAKQAALKILDLLREKDLVGVYGFAGKFHKILEPTSLSYRDKVEKAIVSLKLGSGTNIYEAFKKISEEVDNVLKNTSVPVIRLIFLTDGQPTTGPKKPEKILEMVAKLAEKKVSALVIGVGSDYNEKLLLRIANVLNGVFEHVDKPKRLEKIMYEYTMVAKEVSARNVNIVLRVKPEFRVIIYNKQYVNVPGGVEIRLGDISYREVIDIVGDLETPPLTRGKIHVGEVQVSYTNPETNDLEFTTPIPIELASSSIEELKGIKLSEEVLAKAQAVKTASRIEDLLEKGKGKDIIRELNELVEMTMRVGSEELTSRTINIRERIEKEGLTPDLSKEIASIVSRIVSGKLGEKKKEGVEE